MATELNGSVRVFRWHAETWFLSRYLATMYRCRSQQDGIPGRLLVGEGWLLLGEAWLLPGNGRSQADVTRLLLANRWVA
ncbi:MAG: hypothetical protein KME42_23715 [Tildeniella nuda ZEHNDER 1965/U140]|nr:hypothetical protein [Tildeniella nuda ZEHNDER 1965/U140]